MTSTLQNTSAFEVLHDPSRNKSPTPPEAERPQLELAILMSDVAERENLQLQRVMQQRGQKNTDLERYIALVNLLDYDETLLCFARPIRLV